MVLPEHEKPQLNSVGANRDYGCGLGNLLLSQAQFNASST
jgi:hypothetical protein